MNLNDKRENKIHPWKLFTKAFDFVNLWINQEDSNIDLGCYIKTYEKHLKGGGPNFLRACIVKAWGGTTLGAQQQ
jgi:hypothetical protein